MTRRRIVEWCKNILIVLLACSAAMLAVMASTDGRSDVSALIARVERWFGADESVGQSSGGARVQAASTPVEISVQSSAGRSSAMYDAQALGEAYERFGGLLGQALESAQSAQECGMSDVQGALAEPSVYFRYPGAVPLAALARWLDAEYTGDASASWFALSIRDGAVCLLFGDGTQVFTAKTYLQAERLSRELERARPDGTVFAFESEALATLEPLTLLDMGAQHPVMALAAASVWSDSFVTETASRLGFNPYGEGYYTESDGTLVFSESGCTLRIGTDGSVRLTNQLTGDARFDASDDSLPAQIEAARALLALVAQDTPGDAVLTLTGVETDGAETRLTFEYYVNGIRVSLTDGPAARATLRGGTVTALTAHLRSYEAQTGESALLPARQAVALVSRGTLRVGYADSGDSTPGVGWVNEE